MSSYARRILITQHGHMVDIDDVGAIIVKADGGATFIMKSCRMGQGASLTIEVDADDYKRVMIRYREDTGRYEIL